MHNLDLKIAVRTFLKDKWYNLLNIGGLALGLAAFILVTLYVDNETSYDRWNPRRDRIFLIERELPNGPSLYTPGQLAAAIQRQCPEVEQVGRINTALFQLPFHTPSGRYQIRQWVGADYTIATLFGIKPNGFALNPDSDVPTVLLSKRTAAVLFPGDPVVRNRTVTMQSKTGMLMTIAGVAEDAPGRTHLTFDCIGFSQDITQGRDQGFANPIYQTYVLVKPQTDPVLLAKKIDRIYREAALSDTSQVAREALQSAQTAIYLDPLENLHLQPHYGSRANDQLVKGLVLLAILILGVTGMNFTNLYVTQATRRSKEVGIKKVNGISKGRIVGQFLTEVFLQCCLALLLAFGLVATGLPYVNQFLGVDLLLSGITSEVGEQLLLTLVVLTGLSGLYPALVMAGFTPAQVLKENQSTRRNRPAWIRSALTVLQFTFAIGFVITLIVINQQVMFMKSEDPGFSARQVVYIDNLGIYNHPASFEPVSARIKAIAGVQNVTVASNVPGGLLPATVEYTVRDKAYALQTVAVGYNYFETLAIGLKEGQVFASSYPIDSAHAVINETAVRALGLSDPIGAVVKDARSDYRIIGVVKDVKANGFEQATQPTIYLMNADHGIAKTQILFRAQGNALPAVLATLGRQWKTINPRDGDNFNYHFLDELYGQLFARQEQLQAVLTGFSALAVLIASLGVFALAAQSIRVRLKEIAIRKVFGAQNQQLLMALGKPFLYLILLANGLAWPIALFVANAWLETFAYRVHLTPVPFVTALAVSLGLVALTVGGQILRAVGINPAARLKQ